MPNNVYRSVTEIPSFQGKENDSDSERQSIIALKQCEGAPLKKNGTPSKRNTADQAVQNCIISKQEQSPSPSFNIVANKQKQH